MDVAGFRRLFRTVLLSSGSAALAGCGSETDMPERVECIRFDAPDRYARLTVSPGIDGIAFATLGQDVQLAAIGTPCARAANSDACRRRVAELLSEHDEPLLIVSAPFPVFRSVIDVAVVSAGDDVRRVSFEELRRAVAPVESAAEAATLARSSTSRRSRATGLSSRSTTTW